MYIPKSKRSLRDHIIDHTTVKISRDMTDEEAQAYLMVLVNGMLQVALISKLEGTKAYRQDIKMYSNRLNDAILKGLGKHSDRLDTITVEDRTFFKVVDDLDHMINALVNMRVDDCHMVTRFIELVSQNPQAIADYFNKYEGQI